MKLPTPLNFPTLNFPALNLPVKALAIILFSLTLSACSGSSDDDDAVNNSDDSANPVDTDITGNTEDGADANVNGEFPENESSDDEPTTVADTEANGDGTGDGGTLNVTGNNDAMENNSGVIPPDCGIVTLPNNGQVCLSSSEGEGNTLFSLTESGDVDFSAVLPDDALLLNARIISGSNLYVLSPTRENQSNWGVTAIDTGGNVQYTSILSGNIANVETGFSIDPFLFLHVVDEAGESRIIQINESTGAIGNIVDLSGQNIERVGSESFDGATFISILSNGETTYRDSERLEPYARGFTFAPDTFEREFVNLMNLTRANYMAQFIDAFRQTNAFAETASAGTIQPCAVGGTVEILPQSSFFFTNDITRAYSYSNCILNSKTLNGTIIYRSQTTPPAPGSDTTLVAESLEFDEVAISRLFDSPEQQGIIMSEVSTVTARIDNALDIAGSGNIVETNKDVTTSVSSYVQSTGDTQLVSISDATYQAKSYQLLDTNPSAGTANLRESGGMTLVLSPELTISSNITEPLYYEIAGAEAQQTLLSQAPESGQVRVRSSDGSTLDVNANLSGVNMQNYLLVQAGMQTSIDSTWNIAPVSIARSLIDLP